MPEDVIAKLSQFTPTSGLDRDELLFRAGRASAPSTRVWKAAASLLAIGQLATVVAWAALPPPEPMVVHVPVDVHVPVETPVPPPVDSIDPTGPVAGTPEKSSYFVMSRSVSEGLLPAPEPPVGSPAESGLVLTAGSHGAVIE